MFICLICTNTNMEAVGVILNKGKYIMLALSLHYHIFLSTFIGLIFFKVSDTSMSML